ncbi:shikimate kinase [Schleiferilactobacillus perolens]|uniref:Shikimate kinase n=1 Tax=Schleiferilactobacillus perolens DSM 12744 TaxID=1423792 RepID=A0A0R1N824_9LACO|nr:shikimate kinase [Schleiferilactobacillus perolens]KRL13123.1 hypothetical protein FD09_GL002667 [Schleiferilactobacillus perolens DSM 12744]
MNYQLVLIGFMGAGKTTLSQALGRANGLPVLDTDELVTQQAHMPINEIFSQEGEAGFRQREHLALLHALTSKPAIIATGGGIITQANNRQVLQSLTVPVVLLTASPAEIKRRLAGTTDRPLFKKDWPSLMAKRNGWYTASANRVLPTTGRAISELVQELQHIMEEVSIHD